MNVDQLIKQLSERPDFLSSPALSHLFTMMITLAQELAVKSERIDTLERYLADKGLLDLSEAE